jgi:hypothetical protein
MRMAGIVHTHTFESEEITGRYSTFASLQRALEDNVKIEYRNKIQTDLEGRECGRGDPSR